MQRINSADKRRLRSWLCDKHGGRCCYCGKTIGGAGTVDHYLPQALGGTNAKPNLRWACRPCNQQKGHGMNAGSGECLLRCGLACCSPWTRTHR